ncbi:MAG: hypothetical protein ACM3TN_26475 [Alphaproteobacteria bacterium]
MAAFHFLLSATVFTPLLGAVSFTLPPWRGHILRWVPLAALPALALALFAPIGVTLEPPWIVKGTGLRYDAITQVFMLFTSILWLAAG